MCVDTNKVSLGLKSWVGKGVVRNKAGKRARIKKQSILLRNMALWL